MIRKLLFLILMSLCTLQAQAREHQLARLHYQGGGDWYNDQDIIPNIAEYLNKTISTKFSVIEAIVKPDETKLFDYPFVFMTGHGTVSFNKEEAANIKSYLERGGFIFADDDYGMDSSFRKEMQKIFPDRAMIELPASHNIFNSYFNFPKGLPKIHKHDDKRPQAFGLFNDQGRLMLLYTYESNISDGWSAAHDDPQEIKKQALQFGANIFYYIMNN
ncbi:MAG: DUF4159 domain-containing protein [Candidatus Cloacimonetes bacterium]|nr:DUF4159 domain-containing protein [Candidatus Cloacimonadota bacterium]